MKEKLRRMVKDAGAVAVGFSPADEMPEDAAMDFHKWLSAGNHASMLWLERHEPLRRSPQSILPGAVAIISAAFSFRPRKGDASNPHIATYALGRDYHKVLRRRLAPVADFIRRDLGAEARVCIDSAPIAERYRAIRAGIGERGLSGMILSHGGGAMTFLAEIVTTLAIPADPPSSPDISMLCAGCRLCVDSCPTGALLGDGTMDASRCLSYLTIEHQGPFPEDCRADTRGDRLAAVPVFGCDVCVKVCPAIGGERLDEFAPIPEIANLNRRELDALSAEEIRRRFGGCAIVRLARRR